MTRLFPSVRSSVLGLCRRRVRAPLDFKEWGLLAVQDGGRRKPMDTHGARDAGALAPATRGDRLRPDMGALRFPAFHAARIPMTGARSRSPRRLPPLAEKLGLDAAKKQFSYMDLAHASLLGTLVQEAHDVRDAGDKPDKLHEEAENVAARHGTLRPSGEGRRLSHRPRTERREAGVGRCRPISRPTITQDQFAPAAKALQAHGRRLQSRRR